MRKRFRWLCGLACVGLLAVGGLIAWEATRPEPPIRDFYARIQPGMTRAEVQAVFGPWWDCKRQSARPAYDIIEGEVTPGPGGIITWDWYDRAVVMSLDANGCVQEKALARVEWVAEPWDRRIRRALGIL
jgi:hypothetical protein